MSDPTRPYEPLTSENASLVLIDHQVGPERSMRISRTALSCLLRLKAYGASPAGAAFGAGRTTR